MGKISVGLIALIVLAGSLVSASLVIQHYHPNIGTINQPEFQEYLDEVPLADEAAINWESCDPGFTYYFDNYTVVNTGNMPLNVTLIPYGLPAGWSFAWQGNNTVLAPSQQVGGWLNLTIPVGATTWPDCGFYLRGE